MTGGLKCLGMAAFARLVSWKLRSMLPLMAAALVALPSGDARAQETAAAAGAAEDGQTQQLDEIVVLGSRRQERRSATDSLVPVDIIDGDDLLNPGDRRYRGEVGTLGAVDHAQERDHRGPVRQSLEQRRTGLAGGSPQPLVVGGQRAAYTQYEFEIGGIVNGKTVLDAQRGKLPRRHSHGLWCRSRLAASRLARNSASRSLARLGRFVQALRLRAPPRSARSSARGRRFHWPLGESLSARARCLPDSRSLARAGGC